LEERTIFFFPSSGPFKLSKPGPVLLSGKAYLIGTTSRFRALPLI
jgi:hypothetical protein